MTKDDPHPRLGAAAIAALAIALLLPLPALAQEADAPPADATETAEAPDEQQLTFRPIASFFSRYELRRNHSSFSGGPSDFVRYRARLGVESDPWTLADRADIQLRFVPQASGFWHVGGDTLEDANLGLHEGYMHLDVAGIGLQVGRFEMAYGDQLVIGPVGWHPTARSFDGLRVLLRYTSGLAVDVFATLVSEGVTTGVAGDELGAGDLWFFGTYFMLGELLGADAPALDLYALSRVVPRDTGGPAADPADPPIADRVTTAELTLGARVKGNAGDADYRLEAGVQLGRHPETPSQDTFAYQAEGEVGYTLTLGTNPLRIGLLGLYATGDDPETEENEAWSHLYPTAHKFLGVMDFTGARANVMGGGLLLGLQMGNRWKAYMNVYEFARPQDAVVESGHFGNEVDLGLRYGFGPGVGLRFGYALFVPSSDLSDALGEDLLHFAEVELRADLP